LGLGLGLGLVWFHLGLVVAYKKKNQLRRDLDVCFSVGFDLSLGWV